MQRAAALLPGRRDGVQAAAEAIAIARSAVDPAATSRVELRTVSSVTRKGLRFALGDRPLSLG